MRGRAPESLWERLMRTLDRADDEEEHGVDGSMISFHLLFIVPILLVLVTLIRH